MTTNVVPIQTPADVASEYAALQFVVESILKRVQTALPVKVVAVTTDGSVAPVGRVDVVPLVNQVSGDGTAVPHATIFNVPYSRLQGGDNAVILDPQVGDIGVCVFASRDISAVKAAPQAAVDSGGANPGSARTYNFADGIYLGGILNGTPTQFVQFHAAGIRVFSPTKVTLEAPTIELKGDVAQSGGDITATGSYTGEGDVKGNGVSLHDHKTAGVTPGGGISGLPIPS